MSWKEQTQMESRKLFIEQVKEDHRTFSELCQEFSISRKTGYKWWKRYQESGEEGLQDHSRRPHRIVYHTAPEVENSLLQLRKRYPKWGVRKLCAILERHGGSGLEYRTAHRILQRQGQIPASEVKTEPLHSFVRSHPNELWQMDHKAALHLRKGTRVVPFTVLDDCSRYLIGLFAQTDKGTESTWNSLWQCFRKWGLPAEILSDNDGVFCGRESLSQIEARLIRLGIQIYHGKYYHPQTQGKVERIQGTLQIEALENRKFRTPAEVQDVLDTFRERYNYERPHESLNYQVPGQRYQPSRRQCPATLPPIEYPPQAKLRKVGDRGGIMYHKWALMVGRGLAREWVELREQNTVLDIYYGPVHIHRLDMTDFTKTSRQQIGGRFYHTESL